MRKTDEAASQSTERKAARWIDIFDLFATWKNSAKNA